MRLAIVGLEETFFRILRPYLDRMGVCVVSVMAGQDNEQEGKELAADLNAVHAASVEQIIDVGCDGVLEGGRYCDRPTQITALLEAGIPVFSTKVVAADYPGTLAVIEAARHSGTVLMSGSAYRHAPAILQTIDAVRSGEWGRPVYARMFLAHGMASGNDRLDCGGMLTHYAVHSLSPIVGLIGDRVACVSALGGVYSHDGLDSEDAVIVNVQFANDAIGVAEVLACQQPSHPATVPELDIHCTERSVRIPFPEGPAEDWYGKAIHNRQVYDVCNGYAGWMTVFQEAIERGEPPAAYEEYLEVAAALHMARVSRHERRTVHREEIEAQWNGGG